MGWKGVFVYSNDIPKTKDTEMRDSLFAFQNLTVCLGKQRGKQMIVIYCASCSNRINSEVAQRLPEGVRGRAAGI